MLIYCLGSLPFVNFALNAGIQEEDLAGAIEVMGIPSAETNAVVGDNGAFFIGGVAGFMRVLPITSWFYVGLESLAFVCTLVKEPKQSLPRGSIAAILVLFVTALFTLFVCVSQSPGAFLLSSELAPLNYGFSSMFNIDFTLATGFSIPATYATAFGFQATAGKLMLAMADSKLLPTPLRIVMPGSKMPFVAYVTGASLGFFICYMCYFIPYLGSQLFNICILNGFIGYCSQCIGYFYFQTKFQSLERGFRSPLYIYGSIYAATIFSLGIIGVVGFQPDQFAFYAVLVLMSLFSVYYYLVARKKQTFSADEQKIMLRVHVVNYNTKKGTRTRRKSFDNSWYENLAATVSGGATALARSLSGSGKILASSDEPSTMGRIPRQSSVSKLSVAEADDPTQSSTTTTATTPTVEEPAAAAATPILPGVLARRGSKTGSFDPQLTPITETEERINR